VPEGFTGRDVSSERLGAAREREPLRGKPATALGLRFAMQIFFIGLIA
jgi:hypothetical protein